MIILNVYQQLVSLGRIPDDCIGNNVISVFKSESGHFGVGLFNEICLVEKENEKYKVIHSLQLSIKMLYMTFQEILTFIRQLHYESSLEINYSEASQGKNKDIIGKAGKEMTISLKSRKIQEKLGLRKRPGLGNIYETAAGVKAYIKYSGTRLEHSYSWFGVAPKQLNYVDFVILICWDIDKSLVFPVYQREHCGQHFQGLKELLKQGPTALKDGNWKLKVHDYEDFTFTLEGSSWKADVSNYWSRFDLISGEDYYFEQESFHPMEHDESCTLCDKMIAKNETSYIIFDSKQDTTGMDRNMYGIACSKCAWSDKETLQEVLHKRKDYHIRAIKTIETLYAQLWPKIESCEKKKHDSGIDRSKDDQ